MTDPISVLELPWRREKAFRSRTKDIFLKGTDFAWKYRTGIVLTEEEILNYPVSTLKKIIKLKKTNAIRSLTEMYAEDVEICLSEERKHD